MKTKINLMCLGVFLLLTGCNKIYVIGDTFKTESVTKIIIGETTKNDIVNMLGEPFQKGLVNNVEWYIYLRQEYKFDTMQSNSTITVEDSQEKIEYKQDILYIEFNSDGTVKNYYYNIPPNLSLLENTTQLVLKYEIERRQRQSQQQQMMQQNLNTPYRF